MALKTSNTMTDQLTKKVYNARSKPMKIALFQSTTTLTLQRFFSPLRSNQTKPSAKQKSAIAKLVDVMSLSDDHSTKKISDDINESDAANPISKNITAVGTRRSATTNGEHEGEIAD